MEWRGCSGSSNGSPLRARWLSVSGGASSRDKYGRSGVQWQVGFFVSAQQLAISLRLHKLSITDGHLRKVMHQGHMLRLEASWDVGASLEQGAMGHEEVEDEGRPCLSKTWWPDQSHWEHRIFAVLAHWIFRQSAKKVTASKTDAVGANSFLHVEGPYWVGAQLLNHIPEFDSVEEELAGVVDSVYYGLVLSLCSSDLLSS